MLAYAISAAIIKPFERLNNRRYIKKAVKKLDGFERLFRIGITGSYGKTSVKNILYKMLSKKYKTVATDKNYNTPLGIVKTLQKIDGATEIFIVEMGARRKGEIRELCGMVKPHCGVITGITNQHTETFKTLDNVIATKSELYFGRQEGGVCFFNGDDENIIGLPLLNNDDAVVVTTGLRSDGGGATARRAYARAESVVTTTGGCSFILSFGQNFPRRNKLINGDLGDGGQAEGAAFSPTDNSAVSIAVSTRLIGRASVTNISVAAAVAYYLGVSAEEIKQAIEELEPTAHRTEVIRSGDMTIIDDAYNCNPVGAASAIDVLKLFGGRKLVVTCGFAEQGKNLAAENARLGGLIAEAADAVILIGRGGKYIKDGLLERGFAEQSVYEYPSLSEAKKHFPEIFASGDVILFENDMPDNAE
jgi:UDP-N-acetylmuramoyl-tripeptide--D-alanyl-D-alanine ligase